MKQMIICLSLVFLLFGCSDKDKQEDPVGKQEDVQKEQALRGDDGNYRELNLSELKVENKVVSLQYSFDAYPIGLTYAIHLLQNGEPIPFAFEKDGEYATTQIKTFKKETNKAQVYIHPHSFEKGDNINFGMTFHNNPDYIPELQEFTRYSIEQQFPTGMSYVLTAKTSFDGTESLLLKDIKWEQTGAAENQNLGNLYYENDSAEVLKGLAQGKAVNDVNVMHVEKGKNLSISVMQKSVEGSSGIISFYIDHQLVKIEGKYDSASLQFSEEGYGITTFQLAVPDDIKKGNHTFYASIVDIPSLYDKYNSIELTQQRVLVLE